MGAFVIPLVLVILVVVLAAVLWMGIASSTGVRTDKEQHERVRDDPQQLAYQVPDGQDPAAIATTLTLMGFETTSAPGVEHQLLIRMPLGPHQREEVRVAIENEAKGTLNDDRTERTGPGGPVRFVDER